jgi:hypothetical protein
MSPVFFPSSQRSWYFSPYGNAGLVFLAFYVLFGTQVILTFHLPRQVFLPRVLMGWGLRTGLFSLAERLWVHRSSVSKKKFLT